MHTDRANSGSTAHLALIQATITVNSQLLVAKQYLIWAARQALPDQHHGLTTSQYQAVFSKILAQPELEDAVLGYADPATIAGDDTETKDGDDHLKVTITTDTDPLAGLAKSKSNTATTTTFIGKLSHTTSLLSPADLARGATADLSTIIHGYAALAKNYGYTLPPSPTPSSLRKTHAFHGKESEEAQIKHQRQLIRKIAEILRQLTAFLHSRAPSRRRMLTTKKHDFPPIAQQLLEKFPATKHAASIGISALLLGASLQRNEIQVALEIATQYGVTFIFRDGKPIHYLSWAHAYMAEALARHHSQSSEEKSEDRLPGTDLLPGGIRTRSTSIEPHTHGAAKKMLLKGKTATTGHAQGQLHISLEAAHTKGYRVYDTQKDRFIDPSTLEPLKTSLPAKKHCHALPIKDEPDFKFEVVCALNTKTSKDLDRLLSQQIGMSPIPDPRPEFAGTMLYYFPTGGMLIRLVP